MSKARQLANVWVRENTLTGERRTHLNTLEEQPRTPNILEEQHRTPNTFEEQHIETNSREEEHRTPLNSFEEQNIRQGEHRTYLNPLEEQHRTPNFLEEQNRKTNSREEKRRTPLNSLERRRRTPNHLEEHLLPEEQRRTAQKSLEEQHREKNLGGEHKTPNIPEEQHRTPSQLEEQRRTPNLPEEQHRTPNSQIEEQRKTSNSPEEQHRTRNLIEQQRRTLKQIEEQLKAPNLPEEQHITSHQPQEQRIPAQPRRPPPPPQRRTPPSVLRRSPNTREQHRTSPNPREQLRTSPNTREQLRTSPNTREQHRTSPDKREQQRTSPNTREQRKTSPNFPDGEHRGTNFGEERKGGTNFGDLKGGTHFGDEIEPGNNFGEERKGGTHFGYELKGGTHFGDEGKGGTHFGDERKGGINFGEERKGGTHFGDEIEGGTHFGGEIEVGTNFGDELKGGTNFGEVRSRPQTLFDLERRKPKIPEEERRGVTFRIEGGTNKAKKPLNEGHKRSQKTLDAGNYKGTPKLPNGDYNTLQKLDGEYSKLQKLSDTGYGGTERLSEGEYSETQKLSEREYNRPPDSLDVGYRVSQKLLNGKDRPPKVLDGRNTLQKKSPKEIDRKNRLKKLDADYRVTQKLLNGREHREANLLDSEQEEQEHVEHLSAMRRAGESPVRVLETNIDFPPLSLNGDLNLNKGGGGYNGNNGNNGRGSVQYHHHHDPSNVQYHHHHENETEAGPTDTMLSHAKYPIPDDEEEDIAKRGKFQKVAHRHGLTTKGLALLLLIGCLCLLLLVALLVLVVMWPRDEAQNQKDVCLTPDCLRASAQLQGNLDRGRWPCEDFWGYSCGGWLQDHPVPPTRSRWSVADSLKHQALSDMRELLDTMDEPEDVNSIEWKLRTFYASCMNLNSFMSSGLDQIKRIIISQLNGWTLMRETWDRRRWEFDVVLTRLHAEYGVSPFFKVTVVPDPRRDQHMIIKLLPSGFSMPHRSYYDRMPNNDVEQTYKQYIKDTVKLFDASGPDALEFAAHLFHYESRIAEITPPESVLDNPLASNNLISIGELSQIARSVPWLALLRQMFPNSKLDHRTDVLVVSREYFSDVSELISTTDRNLLNNYLIFNFVTAYIPYLSSENTRVLHLYHKEFTGRQESLERWEFCIQSTAKFFSFGLESLYERSPARFRARQENVRVLTEIFNQIKSTLRTNLANSRWYPLEIKAQLTAKLTNMSLAVGYPDRLLDPEVVNLYYDDYTIFIKDFFKNLQDSVRSAGRQLEMKLIDPMPESGWMDALTKNSVTFVHEANKIIIPPHILNPPLFHRNYPLAMLYGTLGVRIAREMLRSLDRVGLGWNSRGQIVERSVYTNRSLDNLRSRSDCIASAVKELSVEVDAVVDKTARDTASEVDAVRQTYQAYLTLMRYKPQPLHPSFEALNTTNIFFMAYAGSLCSSLTMQQEDIERACSPSLMNKPRLEAVLSQLPEFSQTFSCPPDSRHYPHRLCTQLH